jgi:integrase
MAPATENGYAIDWRVFCAWCARKGCRPLPSSPDTLVLFIASQLADGKKVTTVQRQACGIAFVHRREGYPSPCDDSVHKTLLGARRLAAEQPRQMRPLTIGQLRLVAAKLKETPGDINVRNRAILVLGFATALRRVNLAALLVADITFCVEGMTVLVRREKQDRKSEGRHIGAPFGKNELTCPVRSLQAWLALRGTKPGPLFVRLDHGGRHRVSPLTVDAIGRIVKGACAAVGLEGNYGPHSLRAGFITEAGLAGVNALLIAEQSGHKSLESLKRYFRPANLFKANASSMIGL